MGLLAGELERVSAPAPEVPQIASVEVPRGGSTTFTDQGAIPSIAADVEPRASASELAFGDSETGPAKDPVVKLTAAQLADGKRYYSSQPQKYSKAVLIDIQNTVGATPTGKANDETVQKIAEFQAHINATRNPNPPLKVDGKAGPRTLPILIPKGLATDEQIDQYSKDIVKHDAELENQTLEQRAETLLEEVNKRLDAVQVPRIKTPVKLDDALNEFVAETWQMTISKPTLAKPHDAAATMYHEARHAEQSFRIARMLAGKHTSKAEIMRQTRIKDDGIVDQAIDNKIERGTVEAVQAEGWHENEPGRPTEAQHAARTKASAERFKAAAKAHKQNPTDETHARASVAYEDFKAAQVDSYRNKPNEYDGFFLGEKVGDNLGVSRGADLPLDEAIEIAAKIP